MDVVSSSQSGMEMQMSLFDAVIDMLLIKPVFLLGAALIGVALAVIFRKDRGIPRGKTTILSLGMYYYLCVMLSHIVGIPTLGEWMGMARLGESLFHPNINLIPLSDGVSLSFILNIFLFIPLGFLCPLISKTFARAKNTFFMGLGLSLFIEIIQLFTLHRVTDINDLLTNLTGTMIGYLCFYLLVKLRVVKDRRSQKPGGRDYTAYMPVVTAAAAAVLGFFS